MMKKSLIALAVLAASGTAFAATSNVDVYGELRLAYENCDTNDGVVKNRNSRIGVKGSEDLGGGMSAIYKAEFLIGSTTGNGAAGYSAGENVRNRDQFVGLKGGFGTVIVGSHNSPEKITIGGNMFEDTLGDKSQILGEESGYKDRVIAYVSPDFNGFHAAAAAVTVTGAGVEEVAGTSYALVYANGPLSVAAGATSYDAAASADSKSLTIGYKIGDVALRATTQKSEAGTGGANTDYSANYVDATYKMGAFDLTAAYGKRNVEGTGADLKATTVGVRYNLSKRTNVQAVYNDYDSTTNSADAGNFALHVNHSF